jgi:hypothetical protein
MAPAGEVRVRELVAATPAAHARLWGFLLDQDLTRTITWDLAPVDEPLWLMLTDPRAVRMTLADSLWARLVDVAAALGARSYASDADMVIEVGDDFCCWMRGATGYPGVAASARRPPPIWRSTCRPRGRLPRRHDAALPGRGGPGTRAQARSRRAGVGCVSR